MNESSGKRFRAALAAEEPLQIAGAVNAYSALLAERAGFRALYLSGAGVANASLGLPDLGVTALGDVLMDARRITGACGLPLLVDADTGFGNGLMIGRTVRELERAGVAGMHIEDQQGAKRCGHRDNKRLVDIEEMCARVRAAVAARTDPEFVIMARTDALASEGLDLAVKRARSYVEAGADMIFAEAVTELQQYRTFARETGRPVLANMTEFGRTPLAGVEELRAAGVAMVLYPLSGFRAMSAAAARVYGAIRQEGGQGSVLDLMQTRAELYDVLEYERWEAEQDRLSR